MAAKPGTVSAPGSGTGVAPDVKPPQVTFLAASGGGSLGYYSQKLAAELPIPVRFTAAYERERGDVAPGRIAGLREDAGLIAELRRVPGFVHFSNQHFGRYALAHPRAIVTVHDLMRLFDLRGARPPLVGRPRGAARLKLRLDHAGLRSARALHAVSATTKRDLVEQLGIDPGRIAVVHAGVDHDRFRPVERRLIAEPYLLYVGSEQPRKNLETLLRAFALLKRSAAGRELKLVKAGSPGNPAQLLRGRTLAVVEELGLERDVVFLDDVPEAELPGIYSGAECFVLPSLYEGFGLTPLEAMACGCPAIVSDRGSLPEIAGGGAIVTPALDVRALAGEVGELVRDRAARAELAQRGRHWAARYSWRRAARETLDAYATLGIEQATGP